ncbi:uncharacterized protein LAESUDRAFT_731308 [Laetiporus sulphureus 93-53]|uniref:Extracellular membrane protein CFEM domain-containing protein n=1 Tax=Laetiporus sulphureus 93-53 TaxID=1314785 RepID=A0A165BMP8_9APHY|nr:uncharacterized protein LAESUDRAFT_731308 [Laetiporus sulphureus 93-53]KZT01319.1 hypothetical protein LAESUDRAFT_731308 [Laetiporus sulphureus 93-53]
MFNFKLSAFISAALALAFAAKRASAAESCSCATPNTPVGIINEPITRQCCATAGGELTLVSTCLFEYPNHAYVYFSECCSDVEQGREGWTTACFNVNDDESTTD